MFIFEDQIVVENRKRVRKIHILIEYSFSTRMVEGSEETPQSRSTSDPSCSSWIAALKACRFEKIVHLSIKAETFFRHGANCLFFTPCSTSKDLQEYIEERLGRMPGTKVPRLWLKGCPKSDREKFPQRWNVEMY